MAFSPLWGVRADLAGPRTTEEDSERDAPWTACGETPQPLCRLSFRIFKQPVREIPCPVHDAFDTKGIAFHVFLSHAKERAFWRMRSMTEES